MTSQPHTKTTFPETEDYEAVDLASLFEEIVLSDRESQLEYLKTQWIERVLNELVSLRARNNVTQRQLGDRIGKPQSSIARIEAASDLKLSVLWDYLSGMGLTPEQPLQIKALDEELRCLRRHVICCPTDNEEFMRTARVTDDELLAKARRLTGMRETTDVLREALTALIERESARRLPEPYGSEPELTEIPRRRSKTA